MPYKYRVLPGGRRVAERTIVADTLAGTAADVLNAVGNDAIEARRYLDAELASDSPRKTLVAKLEKLANPDA
jgi:hypothetical protein